jgi:hypothetical protein
MIGRLSGLVVSWPFFKAVRAGLAVKRPYLSHTGRASPAAADARQHKEDVQISSLKGDQISAQGFNPGLGNSRRCALKGLQNPALYRIEFILAPLSGRIFAWRVPRVETLGSALLPLRGADPWHGISGTEH